MCNHDGYNVRSFGGRWFDICVRIYSELFRNIREYAFQMVDIPSSSISSPGDNLLPTIPTKMSVYKVSPAGSVDFKRP